MGKIPIISKEQKGILDLIADNRYLSERFYFTGGTALSYHYLKHRYSQDLDFFSESKIDQEVILGLISSWSRKHKFRFDSRFVEVVYRFDLRFKNGVNFKVDFGYYPYKRVEKGIRIQSLEIDSLRDIATNKLLTINQRNDAKDFADLYFLLRKHFTVWDLIYSAEVKFSQMIFERFLIAQDFLKAEDFTLLPKMILPLTLSQLKSFFREQAKTLGRTVTE